MPNDLLSLIQPALDEMTKAGFATGWTIAKVLRDTVEFERADKQRSIFWDDSAGHRWMASDANDSSVSAHTLPELVEFAGLLGFAL